MFPIKDTIPSRTTPYVVYGIIALNFLFFLYEIRLGLISGSTTEAILKLFYTYGLVPARYTTDTFALEMFGRELSLLEQLIPFFSSVFLHGGIMHFLGNMWMLYIFGDNIEDRLGHYWFPLFYLASGVAAGLVHMLFSLGSPMPTIGASGAIAGVMGAYFLFYPRAKVLTLVPIFFFIQFIELPAYVFLGFWFFLQFISGTALGEASSVAWWAHIGGFAFGALVAFLMGGLNFGKRGGTGTGTEPPRPNSAGLSRKFDDYWK